MRRAFQCLTDPRRCLRHARQQAPDKKIGVHPEHRFGQTHGLVEIEDVDGNVSYYADCVAEQSVKAVAVKKTAAVKKPAAKKAAAPKAAAKPAAKKASAKKAAAKPAAGRKPDYPQRGDAAGLGDSTGTR